jgi:hypothetical protein
MTSDQDMKWSGILAFLVLKSLSFVHDTTL